MQLNLKTGFAERENGKNGRVTHGRGKEFIKIRTTVLPMYLVRARWPLTNILRWLNKSGRDPLKCFLNSPPSP